MKYTDYLLLPSQEKFKYQLKSFFSNLGHSFVTFFVRLWYGVINFFKGIGRSLKEVGYAFIHGNIFTKLSFLFLGAGHMASGQIIKGIIIFLVQVLFIFYMVMFGGSALHGFGTLGNVRSYYTCYYGADYIPDPSGYRFADDVSANSYCSLMHPGEQTQVALTYGDNSSLFLLFGIVAIIILIAFFFYYVSTIKGTIKLQERKDAKLHISTFLEDIKDYLDGKFYKVLLFLPILGICVFTILPLIDMIMMAFTNYNRQHIFPQFFSWIGFENFISLFGGGGYAGAKFAKTFVNIFWWTLIWAFFATFLNYFLGMFVAMLINKKGLKFKKVFRTILVLSIAMPQFISLLAFSKFFQNGGLVEGMLKAVGWMAGNDQLKVLTSTGQARIFIIIVNIWIGIPYTMLTVTGILMNVPADLYESAQIDGASPIKTYAKITLPYVLFITGPKLVTDFVGNINNFNVIYFLTKGGPKTNDYLSAGKTDLLVTWLYSLTMVEMNYSYAAVIGIMIFVICAFFSLIAYRHTSGYKNEEDFA